MHGGRATGGSPSPSPSSSPSPGPGPGSGSGSDIERCLARVRAALTTYKFVQQEWTETINRLETATAACAAAGCLCPAAAAETADLVATCRELRLDPCKMEVGNVTADMVEPLGLFVWDAVAEVMMVTARRLRTSIEKMTQHAMRLEARHGLVASACACGAVHGK